MRTSLEASFSFSGLAAAGLLGSAAGACCALAPSAPAAMASRENASTLPFDMELTSQQGLGQEASGSLHPGAGEQQPLMPLMLNRAGDPDPSPAAPRAAPGLG